jgi:hypothetical protein
MLKKTVQSHPPSLGVFVSPAHPPIAPQSITRDAPFHGRGRSKRGVEEVHTILRVNQRLIGRSPFVLAPLEKSTGEFRI